MEVSDVIVGTRLNEIHKKLNQVKLVFENEATSEIIVVAFEGLLLETSTPSLNHRVHIFSLTPGLGFRTTSQLRHLKQDPKHFRQLFIAMEGSTEENKSELLGAISNLKVSRRTKSRVKKLPSAEAKRKVVRKKISARG
jgi:hypothetical protein